MSPFPVSIWQSPAAKWHLILPTPHVATAVPPPNDFSSLQTKFYITPNKSWSPERDLYNDAFNEEAYRTALQWNADVPPREERSQRQLDWDRHAENRIVLLTSGDSDRDSDSASTIDTDSDSDERETDSTKPSDFTTESDTDDLRALGEDDFESVYHGMNSSR